MMYSNEDAKQFKKELKTLIHAERIHPKVMDVALKAVYGKIHNGTQTVSKSTTGSLSYSSEELEKMFHHLSPERLPNWKPYKLFVPALALYNGLRMNEACQLQVEHIIQDGEISCIQVKGDEKAGCTVKNLSSIRTIPIHPVILQLGFLKLIQEVESGPIWPELKPDEALKGYSCRFEKFFNRKYVAQAERKTFFSLRYNFANALRQLKPQETIVCQMMGKGKGFTRYCVTVPQQKMLELLEKLDYGFDIFAQTGIKPLSKCEVTEQVEYFFKRPF